MLAKHQIQMGRIYRQRLVVLATEALIAGDRPAAECVLSGLHPNLLIRANLAAHEYRHARQRRRERILLVLILMTVLILGWLTGLLP